MSFSNPNMRFEVLEAGPVNSDSFGYSVYQYIDNRFRRSFFAIISRSAKADAKPSPEDHIERWFNAHYHEAPAATQASTVVRFDSSFIGSFDKNALSA